MAIKCVLLFQLTTDQGPFPGLAGTVQPSDAPSIGYGVRPHQAGWSESLWWDGDNLTPLLNAIKTGYGGKPALGPSRAALLPDAASIIGARFYAGGAGKGQSLAFSFPGNALLNCDVPQMALLAKCGPASTAVTRRFTLRCIPDSVVSTGEFAPSTTYAAAIATYFQALGNFSFYAVDPASPSASILNIDGTGKVTLSVNVNPFAVNTIVTISKAINAAGTFTQFTGMITGVGISPATIQLAGWTAGPCTGGKATVKSKSLFLISPATCAVSRVVVRKVGRPFEQYHGRRSKRRRTA